MFSTREILLKVNIQKLNRGRKKEGWTDTQDFHDSETKIPFKLVHITVICPNPQNVLHQDWTLLQTTNLRVIITWQVILTKG